MAACASGVSGLHTHAGVSALPDDRVDVVGLLKRFILWVFSIDPEWMERNGWVNESIAGALGTTFFVLLATAVGLSPLTVVLATIIVFNVVSVLYELYVDPHGWENGVDCYMRIPAEVVVLTVYILTR